MNAIVKKSFLSILFVALFCVQPTTRCINFNDIKSFVVDQVTLYKPYITIDNCFKATIFTGFASFIGYVGYFAWKSNRSTNYSHKIQIPIAAQDIFNEKEVAQETAEDEDEEIVTTYNSSNHREYRSNLTSPELEPCELIMPEYDQLQLDKLLKDIRKGCTKINEKINSTCIQKLKEFQKKTYCVGKFKDRLASLINKIQDKNYDEQMYQTLDKLISFASFQKEE